MKIEIVAHCYCPPGLSFYAEMLKWQWASLVHFPPDCVVDYTVCYTDQDMYTPKRIATCMVNEPPNVYMRPLPLKPQQLFRRAIGRNIRALGSDADVIWMTDIDYLFGLNCINETMRLVRPDDHLCMPKTYWIQESHATGDKMLTDAEDVMYPEIKTDLFVLRKQKIPIGGIQILGGDFARDAGYLKGTKYLQPVPSHQGFLSCRCDRWFRKENNLSATRLDIPELYRIRHSEAGRDYYLDGTKGKGKEAW